MQDVVVAQSLRNRGYGMQNIEDILVYEAIERKPRVLDKAPKRLSLLRCRELPVYSTYTNFIMTYKELQQSMSIEIGNLNIKGIQRQCDPEVFIALQSLIQEGITCSEDKAKSAFDLFRVIAMTPAEYISCGELKKTLDKYYPQNYQAGELYKAIRTCVYGETEVEVYWFEMTGFSRSYPKALELGRTVVKQECETTKDVDKLISSYYSEAKQDQEFFDRYSKEFKKLGVSKALIGMLYHLHKEHPEALNLGEEVPNGFN